MERLERAVGHGFPGDAHDLDPGGEALTAGAVCFAEPAAGSITPHRTPYPAADGKPNLPRPVPIPPEYDQRRLLYAAPPLQHSAKLFAPPEPLASGKPCRLPITLISRHG